MDYGNVSTWGASWAWGLPLIVLTVVFHAYSLGLLNKRAALKLNSKERLLHFSRVSNFLIGGTALLAAILAKCHDKLWTRESLSGAALANDGRPGGAQRLDPVWTHHGISFYGGSESMAAYQLAATARRLVGAKSNVSAINRSTTQTRREKCLAEESKAEMSRLGNKIISFDACLRTC
jgi:hypothetical protein